MRVRYDGDVYRSLYDRARLDPALNAVVVTPGFAAHIKPLLDVGAERVRALGIQSKL